MIDTKRLRAIAKKQGITSFYQLRIRYQESGRTTFGDRQAQRLWEGLTDPKLSTVDELCEVLRCSPCDILQKKSGRN